MKILLYGGSFDPPHNGHLNNLRAAADRVRPDKIVVMPAGTSPFKQGTNASGALRLEMCRCFAALAQEPGMPPLEVSGWEVAQAAAGSRNYTVLTLDMLLSFEGWHRWQDILRLARVVVTSRDIGDAPALHAKAKLLDPSGGRILFAPVQALPMASSQLRARLAAGEECKTELPEEVRNVIRREGLYRNTEGSSR